ncbi:MAG: hypothetical protein M3Y72_27155 [Acidobacteriota bacterium]|nr:hypothetical protein [Acidobacteriota bacterium]
MRLLSSSIHAWRSWKSAKGTGLLAIAGLALGIGSTTAIYTVVQTVLLNPLPFANPGRYLAVLATWRGLPGAISAWSYPNCADFTASTDTRCLWLRSGQTLQCRLGISYHLCGRRTDFARLYTFVTSAATDGILVRCKPGRSPQRRDL